jgi:hypothetical protein
MIPDNEEYKDVEKAVGDLAENERRSKTKMAIILIEEALAARQANNQGQGHANDN